MRKGLMGSAALAAIAALGLAGAMSVAPGPAGAGESRVITNPAAPSGEQKQATNRAAVLARREEAERGASRWRRFVYRKDGIERSAGDRAHKRWKQRRRGGV